MTDALVSPPRPLPHPLRARRRRAARVAAGRVADAADARRGRGVHEAIFAEMTYHAAYEPQRAVRTERWKYIRRFDDSPSRCSPTATTARARTCWVAARLGGARASPASSSTTSSSIPTSRQPGRRPAPADVLEEMRARLERLDARRPTTRCSRARRRADRRRGQRAVADLARRADPEDHRGPRGRALRLTAACRPRRRRRSSPGAGSSSTRRCRRRTVRRRTSPSRRSSSRASAPGSARRAGRPAR